MDNKIKIELTVNGTLHRLEIASDKSLARVLREDLELMGTKISCGAGECGACTVLVGGKAVNSCIVLAAEVAGREITTIEGLAKLGQLDPIQEAFVEEGAIQCGFCTPGMIMSTKGLLLENPDPTEDEIKDALEGNLCRCTGYLSIIRAVKRAAAAMRRG